MSFSTSRKIFLLVVVEPQNAYHALASTYVHTYILEQWCTGYHGCTYRLAKPKLNREYQITIAYYRQVQ